MMEEMAAAVMTVSHFAPVTKGKKKEVAIQKV